MPFAVVGARMQRRRYIRVGVGALTASLVPSTPTRADPDTPTNVSQQVSVEQVLSETYDGTGLATGLSESGGTMLFGFDDGNLLLYDSSRDGVVVPLAIDRSVSHIDVRQSANTAVIGWMDAHSFGFLDLTETEGSGIEHPGLWNLDTTPEADTATVSYPVAGAGSLVFSTPSDGIQWETPLTDAAGYDVAITDDAGYVAVAASQYNEGVGFAGSPATLLFDGEGTELWRHDHAEDVISVGIDADRELVVAGTNDGQTIVLDFDGDVQWRTAGVGGWVELSADGSRLLVTTPPTLSAFDPESGEEFWTADVGLVMGEETTVAGDGSRAFVANRAGAEFSVVEEGEVIWSESSDVGPGVGALAEDGRTWSTNVTDLDTESSALGAYRTS